jgi:hypothetical protein
MVKENGTAVVLSRREIQAPIRPFWSWRAVALSLLLLPLNLYWIGVTEGLWHALHMTTLSLPMNALMLLLTLCWLNGLVGRFFPSWRL